ncbi:MAG: helix-turn-helix domain-containing protein [Victivallales bacterium]|nr:helix-turn-helix domain-containing protein [Victivallales bacterium]
MKVAHLPEDEREYPSSTLMHGHDFYELAVVIRGKAVHVFKKQRLTISTGSVILLAPREKHRYEFEEPLYLMNFIFSPSFLRSWKRQLKQLKHYQVLFGKHEEKPDLHIDPGTLLEIELSLNAIAMETNKMMEGADILLQSELMRVLVLILRNIQQNTEYQFPHGDVISATSYMAQNFQDDISVADLAKNAFMSESTFYRKFRREFKMTPMEWLLNLRIKMAKNLLLRSDMTIGEVAASTGFSDQFYFARTFKKATGYAPRQYSREMRKKGRSIKGETIIDSN